MKFAVREYSDKKSLETQLVTTRVEQGRVVLLFLIALTLSSYKEVHIPHIYSKI